MNRYGTIVSTGRFLPEIEVSNDTLRKQLAHVPDFVDKMESGTGILTRWHAPEGWTTSDVALPAARQALERAHRKPEVVDLIILGTDSPDYITPSTSVVLQHKLGAVNAGTFDVGCASSTARSTAGTSCSAPTAHRTEARFASRRTVALRTPGTL